MNYKKIIFEKLTVLEESKVKAGEENEPKPPYPDGVACGSAWDDGPGDKPEFYNCHLAV